MAGVFGSYSGLRAIDVSGKALAPGFIDTPRTRKGLRISSSPPPEETDILMATFRDLIRGGY